MLVEGARIDPVVTGRFFSSDRDAYYDLATRDEKLVATISSTLAGTAAATAEYEKQTDGSYSAKGTRIVFDGDANGFTLGPGRITAIRFTRVERSEERRVGKECVSPCKSRWWPYH